jgi:hypothetical protein
VVGRHEVRIIAHGVTGRMGSTQHLLRSITAIADAGAAPLDEGDLIWPEPVLVGHKASEVAALAEPHGLHQWTSALDSCLRGPRLDVHFDAQVASMGEPDVHAVIETGKRTGSRSASSHCILSSVATGASS